MPDDPAPAPGAPGPFQTSPRRRTAQRAAIIGFVVLVAALYAVSQMVTRSGPIIAWIDGDLDRALREAKLTGRRIFLYLYETEDPLHARNEREVFSQRWARSVLAGLVCCRVELEPRQPAGLKLRGRYQYDGKPRMILLDPDGEPVVPGIDGEIDQKQFFTYIEQPAKRPPKK